MTAREKNDVLFDAMVKVAITESFKKEMESLPDDEELRDYKSSPVLDMRISGLIKKSYRRTKTKRFMKGFRKAAACLCILVTITSIILMSVGATRNAIFNAVLEWHDKYTQIQFQDSDAQTEGSDNQDGTYRPTYLPDGFNEKTFKPTGMIKMITYENEAGDIIIFDQEPAGSGTTAVDNEHTDYSEVQISGSKGYLFKAKVENNASILIWEKNSTVFKLISVIDSDELIHIGESIKR